MRSGIRPWLIGATLLLVGLAIALIARTAQAQNREPRCLHHACVSNCLAYQYILAGKPNFYAWYDTAYRLTGCGESGWITIRDLLVDVASELVGAPGGYTMQCWQMVLGQASVCRDQCNDFFVKDCRYAPNVRVILVNPQPGYMTVKVENRDPSGGLPEYAPSAFSRQFNTYVYASREGGQKLLIAVLGVPSLSYPTWVNEASYTECVQAYNDARCSMIGSFLGANHVSLDVSWGGGLYDMSGLTKNARGLDSQPSSGHIALKHNGDRVTITQGDYSGYSYVWERNASTGVVTESVTPWSASGGDQTFSNSECNSWLCGLAGGRIDRDTYVFITEGPTDRLLTGQYTVEAEARLAHDKDISDNTTSYSYTLTAPPPPVLPTPTVMPEQMLGSIGPGTHQGYFGDGESSHRYSFEVPPGVEQVRAYLDVPSSADYDLFGRPAVPIPNRNRYPQWCIVCGDCWSSRMGLGRDETCIIHYPQVGTNHLIVRRMAGSGPYTLRLEFIYPTTPTPTPTATATPSPTPSPTPLPMQWENEPNDSASTATQWVVGGPMSGAIAWEGDQDYYRIEIPDSAIYTIDLNQVPAEVAADLTLYRAGTLLIAKHDAGPGEPSSLSFDANRGEVFHLRVRARQRTQYSSQHYVLTMSWLPDPTEPNDRFADATEWNAAEEPIHGYFWERFSGPGDYYAFEIPGSGVVGCTLELSDVAANVTPYLIVYRPDHTTLASHRRAEPGDTIQLSFNAEGGHRYFALVRPSSVQQTSEVPYTLSATCGAPVNGTGAQDQNGLPYRHGLPTATPAIQRRQ